MLTTPRKTVLLAGLAALTTLARPALAATATTTPGNIPNTMRVYAATGPARDLLVRADEALNALTYSFYQQTDYWSPSRGVYKGVCVHYVNHLMDEAIPTIYDRVVAHEGGSRLSTWDWYGFLRAIPVGETRVGFKRLGRVADLRPGDVVVYKFTDYDGSGAWGHILLIASVPARDTRWSGAWRVRVTDQSSRGHSNDNRGSTGSGVGVGEMLFRVDSSGRPVQWARDLRGYWHSNASYALGRPTS